MTDKHRFKSLIEQARGPGAAVALVPAEIVPALGGLKQKRALGVLNGIDFTTATFPYKGTLYVGVPKAARQAAGVDIGDEADFELTLDESPRVVRLHPELKAALEAEPELMERFASLSHSRKRLLAEPVGDAKKPETRALRIDKALVELRKLL
jgi:hypothetical protein